MADKSKSFEELREDLYRSIKGVNRYNPENIPNLEKAIRMMIDDHNCYDKDILLTTLKLYQLNVEKFNEAVVAQILLKAMMVFPRNDFALAKYLIDGKFLMEGSKSYSPVSSYDRFFFINGNGRRALPPYQGLLQRCQVC